MADQEHLNKMREGAPAWNAWRTACTDVINLSGADLSGADLRRANLSRANLSGANLRKANLSGADLHWANLSEAGLHCANLSGADLHCANLSGADLHCANLSGADLSRAYLSGANLSEANLSETTGLLSAAEWLAEHFHITRDGSLIVWTCKGPGTTFSVPSHWAIAAGKTITETVNPDRCTECACGVNFGTREWCRSHYATAPLWVACIDPLDLADVVVPYNTDGKARCGRLTLIAEVQRG